MAGEPQGTGAGGNDQANRIVDLYKGVDEYLDSLRIPDDERKEVERNLMEAIAADLLTRLGQRLSEEERQALAASGQVPGTNEPDLQAVAAFFRGRFTEEELIRTLGESTESVLTEFAETLEGRG
ncbi:MAG: hypothetical protein AAB923_02615 [Patescibacteria group bacterium]